MKVRATHPQHIAQQWTARAGGWVVESTFDLLPGWDPALEGQADDAYDKQLSADFHTFADVYRRWVLNEDGYYSQPPYSRGPRFNLADFFGIGDVGLRSTVFGDSLVLDAAGERRPPVVEVSIDGGGSWQIATVPTRLLEDRAGVYLNPETLPLEYLAAAKAGGAQVRVTASLDSPLPVERSRWFGHAQASGLPPKILDVSEHFSFRRVDAGSIHHASVVSGALDADVRDDTNAMWAWLIHEMVRHATGSRRLGGEATLTLAGAWPWLRVGDRLMDARGPGVAVDGRPQAVSRDGATVRALSIDYEPASSRGGRTSLDLTY